MTFIKSEVRLQGDLFLPGKAVGEVKGAIKEQFVKASEFIVGEMQRASPVGATGNLAKAWGYFYVDATCTTVISPNVEYAAAVELGRKAAPVPIKPLELWVKRVINPGSEKAVRRIAFLIARKKRKQPTPGQFFASKRFEAITPILNSTFLGPLGPLIVIKLGG